MPWKQTSNCNMLIVLKIHESRNVFLEKSINYYTTKFITNYFVKIQFYKSAMLITS